MFDDTTRVAVAEIDTELARLSDLRGSEPDNPDALARARELLLRRREVTGDIGLPDDPYCEDWPPASSHPLLRAIPREWLPRGSDDRDWKQSGSLPRLPPPWPATDVQTLIDAITPAAVPGVVPGRGRPPSEDRLRAEGAASFRLDQLGGVDRQAELECELLDWCGAVGLDLSERTVRSIASQAIRAYRARLARD